MKEIKTEITIQASQEQVWQILTDLEKYPSWNPFIISSKGTINLGSKLTNVLMVGGKERTFTPKITELTPGASFAWLGKLPLGLFTGNHYFMLEDLGNGSTRLVHGERFGGLLRGMIMRKIGNETKRGFIAMNEALKVRAEQQA